MSTLLHIALLNPEIPPNTGNVGRLCVGLGARLHVIHPIAFSMTDRQVRRAGLDYWKHVDLQEHASADAFWTWVGDRRVHLFSSHGRRGCHFQAEFARGDVLLFGCETLGLPRALVEARGAWRIPMQEGPIRSLNLANSVAVVAYEAVRQLGADAQMPGLE